MDIALDTFPFNACLTTCDALWMGVPVITLPGETFASRQGLSLLSTVGLTETIATTPDEYVEAAVRLASDIHRLNDLRGGLRKRMEAPPLATARALPPVSPHSSGIHGEHGSPETTRPPEIHHDRRSLHVIHPSKTSASVL